MTDKEKLARVIAIIEDQQALEAHQLKTHATYDEISFGRADVYRYIVEAVLGSKPLAA
jgi:hypothetical protein